MFAGSPGLMFQALFFYLSFINLGYSKLSIFIFYKKKLKKKNWNYICKEFCKKLWKKIILGTSDAWSTGQRTSACSVLYCRLMDSKWASEHLLLNFELSVVVNLNPFFLNFGVFIVLFDLETIRVNQIIIWWLIFDKNTNQFSYFLTTVIGY